MAKSATKVDFPRPLVPRKTMASSSTLARLAVSLVPLTALLATRQATAQSATLASSLTQDPLAALPAQPSLTV